MGLTGCCRGAGPCQGCLLSWVRSPFQVGFGGHILGIWLPSAFHLSILSCNPVTLRDLFPPAGIIQKRLLFPVFMERTWSQISDPPYVVCVTSGKSFILSVLQCLCL